MDGDVYLLICDGPRATVYTQEDADLLVDALNEKEQRDRRLNRPDGWPDYHAPGCNNCGQQPCIHSYVSSDMTSDEDYNQAARQYRPVE